MTPHQVATWSVAALSTAGVIARPGKFPEAVWAVAGATCLVVLGVLPVEAAARAVAKGGDVYGFLTGMMLLAEVARREGLFDWLAALAVNAAKGSTSRLFLLIYAVGTAVTVLLSNDATAVVLTPAVATVARRARAAPLPLLYACAFVANAASFVLPVANPANLVLYGGVTPPLGAWLASFAAPSALAVFTTYVALRLTQQDALLAPCETRVPVPELGTGGRVALGGIALTALVLLVLSARDVPLGLPTALLGGGTAAVVLATGRASPWPVLRDVSWGILPLVAGLFVLVDAVAETGAVGALAAALARATTASPVRAAAGAGAVVGFGCNLVNNLPAGLLASATLAAAHAPPRVTDVVLMGVDLGPNLSITGSLATILWLTALRRDGLDVSFWAFLRVGAVVMPPALALAIGARLLVP